MIEDPVEDPRPQIESTFEPKYFELNALLETNQFEQGPKTKKMLKQPDLNQVEKVQQKLTLLQQNPDLFQVQYVQGYTMQPGAFLWNEDGNYLVFALENMVVFEQLDKGKKQKIVHFNEPVSCLAFNDSKTKLFIGTSQLSLDQNRANIYVLNTQSFRIVTVISFK